MPGETLLHYRIIRKLGAGGMGEVYLAHDTKLGRDVAIKVLPPQLSSDTNRLERFRREASIVAALNHPNIVTIFSVENADGLNFFTMEHVDGKVLSELVPDTGLPAADFRDLALPLVDALSAAHVRGVTHRDLKPGNIMVNRDGLLKVLDFGLAKVSIAETPGAASDSLMETDFLTGHGQILGTTPYMSPEQLKGQPADHRSDIFALGTVLYTMATGKHPFNADSSAEIISSILSHAPPRVSTLNSGLPDELADIIDRCLEKDPALRYQSTGELQQDLARFVLEPASGGPDIRPRAVKQEPKDPDSRHETPPVRQNVGLSMPWTAVAVVAVLVTVGALWTWKAQSRPVPPLRSLAVLPFVNLSGDPELDRLAEAISSGLITTLRELGNLQVVGRTESWSQHNTSPEAMLRELAVGSIVNGEIQQDGVDLRNTITLTDTATGFVLWSHTYTTAADRAYRSQKAIASDLSTYLSIPLTANDRRRMTLEPDGSRAAHDYFVTGQRFLDSANDSHSPGAAAENFRQALRIMPNFALAHVGLSEALWQIFHREGDGAALAEARAEAETACRIDPDSPTAQVALARINRSTGRHDAAIEQLEDVLVRHPKPDEAYRELAQSYERVGNLDEAEAAYRAATALSADDWSNWTSLGTFLVNRGQYDDARDAFVRAVDLAPPDTVRPREQLATYSLAMGRFDEAIEAYEDIPSAVRGPVLASNLGTAYFFSDRPEKWDRAEENYLIAVRLSPRDAVYQANLGDLYGRLGRREESLDRYLRARSLIEERLEEDPEDPALVSSLADFAAKAGDCETAISLAGKLSAVLPDTGPNAHRLAYIYGMCEDDDAALAEIRRAIELGESAELIRHEDEFRSLRSNPAFIALVE